MDEVTKVHAAIMLDTMNQAEHLRDSLTNGLITQAQGQFKFVIEQACNAWEDLDNMNVGKAKRRLDWIVEEMQEWTRKMEEQRPENVAKRLGKI
jgi:hypothetical protein